MYWVLLSQEGAKERDPESPCIVRSAQSPRGLREKGAWQVVLKTR